MSRTLALLGAMTLGVFLPEAHVFAWLIRWLVMAMLFIVFLQTRLSRSALHPTHLLLLFTNVAMGFAAWALGGAVGGRTVALAAFFAGITPTATAAPVVMSFLRGRVDYVIAAFLLTNIAIAALLPVILPPVLGQITPQAFGSVLATIAFVVFSPMAAGWLVRRLYPTAIQWPSRLRGFSFGLWVTALFLITANASDFLRTQVNAPVLLLLQIAGVSLLVCAANFTIGYLIGGREFRREASQALGQKNTTFTIYLALVHASPVVALGPTCYVLWHNVWNSWQLHREARRQIRAPVDSGRV